MINSNDAKNLLALLERVNLSAREVDVFTELRAKLYAVAQGPEPEVGVSAQQEPPAAAGVTMGVPESPDTNET